VDAMVAKENAPRPVSYTNSRKRFAVTQVKLWYKFEEWSNKYGPMITVWIGRSPVLVLNDAWTVSDLMDKRANVYSSRPAFPIPGITIHM